MLRKYFILIVSILLTQQLAAQSYNFKNYSVENGLPFIQIFAIHQDDRGYLWTTGYGGLSRFDGKEFINYGPRNGLANHFASAIATCMQGNLWIGTKDGLNEFVNEKEFRTYTVKQGLPSNTILSLAPDEQGRMYVGTDKGLCYYLKGKFTIVPDLNGSAINCMLYTAKLGLIIGTDQGLFRYADGILRKYDFTGKNEHINCLAFDNTGLWVGTEQGLITLDPETKKAILFGINNGLIDENITTLTCDPHGNTWVGTHSGLMKFNGHEFLYYKISSDINSNNILSSSMDYEDNLWLGTHSGLFRYRDEGFVSFGAHDGLIGTMVFSVIRDPKQVLWVGTEQFGLFKYENNVFEQIKTPGKVIGDTIYSLAMIKGNLFVGNNTGLCVRDGETFRAIKNFPHVSAYRIFLDSRNRMWVGSLGAIYCFDLTADWEARNIEVLHLPGEHTDYQVWGIEEDHAGNYWFGAYMAGLFKYDGKSMEPMNKKLNIKTEDVFNLLKSKKGLFYACSLDGVYEINPQNNTAINFNETNGLSSNLVYSVLLTNNERTLWAGTNQGANKIDLGEFQSTDRLNVTTYGKADGFKGVECNGSIWEDPDGIVWFATVSGLVRYNPNQISRNDREAKLNFTGIQLFYTDTVLSQNCTLPYDLNTISFHYTGICLTNPDKVRYIHKLEGFDRYWSPESDENLARYSNLPPGNYTFKVRCCNNEGVWNQPIHFSFTIEKPYYAKWWFVLSAAGFVISVLILIFRIRLNQLKRTQQKETEKQIEISKNQLKALRSQMNPHFMFNSLNSIQNYIINNKDDRAVLYLNKFARLMRMILNNSEKAMVTLHEELDAMRLYIELEQMRFQYRFQFSITVSDEIDQDFEQIPTMLIQPYVENAILHGLNPKKEDNGLLQLEIRLAGGVMICSIIDNGIGREKSAEMKRNSAKDHKSMGMDITKQRLQLLNAANNSNLSVRINDLKDEKGLPAGTKVDIFIPIT